MDPAENNRTTRTMDRYVLHIDAIHMSAGSLTLEQLRTQAGESDSTG
jgi:hypothetical protein